jgi:hypothetical protein
MFYPKRQRGGIEIPHFLVKAVNSTGRPEPVSSLPSWSYGFDSRRPSSCLSAVLASYDSTSLPTADRSLRKRLISWKPSTA